MKTSIKIKKIIWVFILGIVLLLAIGCFQFFCYMGTIFGFQDINKSDYLESRAFADSLWEQIYSLNYDVEIMNTYEIPSSVLILNEMDYDSINELLRLSKKKALLCSAFLEQGDYGYEHDETGITNVYVTDEGLYNSDWYPISLNQNQIAESDNYAVVSKEDYINLIMSYAKPNAVYISDLTEDELIELMGDSDYDTSMLASSREAYLEKNGEEVSEKSEAVDVEISTEIDNWEYTDAVVYIDSQFDAGVYIGTVEGMTIVYSPDEDMFYSSLYGWYTVPDELYFLVNTNDKYGDDEAIDSISSIGIELVLLPFTDRNTILEEKVAYNYTEYIRAKKDLLYPERNLAFYTYSGSSVYMNANSIGQIKSCEQYLTIHRTDSGEFTVELNNFNNTYITDSYITGLMQNAANLQPNQDMYIGIYTTYPYLDQFYDEQDLFSRYYKYTIPALICGILMLAVAVIIFVSLTKGAGRVSKEDAAIYLNFLDKWPVEIMLLIGIGGLGYLIGLGIRLYYFIMYGYYWTGTIISYFAIILLCYIFVMSAYLSIIRRGKAKQMWDRSLLRTIYRGIRNLIKLMSGQKNLVARTVELFIIYWFVIAMGGLLLLIAMELGMGIPLVGGILLILGANIIVLVSMLRQAKGEQMIREVTEILADGDLNVVMPKGKTLETERQILENIGHLSNGLQKAVEQSISDERMKAELITNVSHDIKTPLTSIINYVDLIKREKIDNDKVIHYVEVLDQKSHRLKQLTEDLVEISKISSGNIELECMPIDFAELIRQSIGEFEDKFAEHELQIIDSISEEPFMIYADGRRTFRVMDNLMQNIYKYAMPKTRVYIDLTKEQEKIILSIKNISKAELNIDVKELMERFVRGDQSRSTEGSGLGLSIAGDLVRIQNGTFDIQLDGDLFKVIITFTEYKPIQDNEDA